MIGSNGRGTAINSFAVVSYLADPLGAFFDRLRQELVPGCRAKAHVTVLPPRPLLASSEDAWRQVNSTLANAAPFRVELGEIKLFPETQVIYMSVGEGQVELERMHQALNVGALAYLEQHRYCPHLTLGQELGPAALAAATELAKRRWQETRFARSFTVDRLTFVQNTVDNCWTDLATLELGARVAR